MNVLNLLKFNKKPCNFSGTGHFVRVNVIFLRYKNFTIWRVLKVP